MVLHECECGYNCGTPKAWKKHSVICPLAQSGKFKVAEEELAAAGDDLARGGSTTIFTPGVLKKRSDGDGVPSLADAKKPSDWSLGDEGRPGRWLLRVSE